MAIRLFTYLKMISLSHCRKLIPDEDVSDEELELIRNSLYESAELAWDIYKDKKYGSKNPFGLLQEDK